MSSKAQCILGAPLSPYVVAQLITLPGAATFSCWSPQSYEVLNIIGSLLRKGNSESYTNNPASHRTFCDLLASAELEVSYR
jgi:hypothetical protein